MIDVREEMRKTAWCSRLWFRQPSVEFMLEYFCNNLNTGRNLIVETGTARAKDGWETDGQSTLIWDWLVGLYEPFPIRVISIDKNESAIVNAASQTMYVEYRCGDSVEILAILPNCEKIGLLYLDSFDWDQRHKYLSPGHLLQELKAVWPRLSPGCLIFVDDMLSPEFGKHAAIAEYMYDMQIAPILFTRQIGWVKP